jgi:hypothetical protein
MGRAADVTNAIIGALTNARFELPAFSTLERTTRHSRALAHRKLCSKVFAQLTAEERQALDRLLVIPVDERRTAVQKIKRLPQRPSRKHLKESVDHLEWLESLGSVGTELKDIAPSLIHDFAKQARTTDAGELKDFTPAKRYTLLLCRPRAHSQIRSSAGVQTAFSLSGNGEQKGPCPGYVIDHVRTARVRRPR